MVIGGGDLDAGVPLVTPRPCLFSLMSPSVTLYLQKTPAFIGLVDYELALNYTNRRNFNQPNYFQSTTKLVTLMKLMTDCMHRGGTAETDRQSENSETSSRTAEGRTDAACAAITKQDARNDYHR